MKVEVRTVNKPLGRFCCKCYFVVVVVVVVAVTVVVFVVTVLAAVTAVVVVVVVCDITMTFKLAKDIIKGKL